MAMEEIVFLENRLKDALAEFDTRTRDNGRIKGLTEFEKQLYSTAFYEGTLAGSKAHDISKRIVSEKP